MSRHWDDLTSDSDSDVETFTPARPLLTRRSFEPAKPIPFDGKDENFNHWAGDVKAETFARGWNRILDGTELLPVWANYRDAINPENMGSDTRRERSRMRSSRAHEGEQSAFPRSSSTDPYADPSASIGVA
ncbi:unnamed protein product, partial [Phaeothamnion confervicola]